MTNRKWKTNTTYRIDLVKSTMYSNFMKHVSYNYKIMLNKWIRRDVSIYLFI